MPYLFNNPVQISPSYASAAMVDGATIHVAYVDADVAYYKRSTNEGASYSSPVTIGAAKSTELTRPLVVGEDGRLHFFYVREVSVADRLMYRYSTDNGDTWSAEQELHNGTSTGFIYRIDAYALSGVVHVAWVWGQDGTMRYRRSDNNGVSWGTTQTPYGTSGLFYRQRIRPVPGGKVHLVFTNNPAGSTFLEDDEIRYGYSNDGGDTWQASVVIGGGANRFALYPDLQVVGNTLIASWVEAAEGTSLNDRDVRYRRSTDAGSSWGSVVSLTDYGEKADHMFSAALGNKVALSWVSNRTGTRRTLVSTSDDLGLTWRTKQVTNTSLVTADSRVGIGTNYLHVFIVTESTFLFNQQRALLNQGIFSSLVDSDDGNIARYSSGDEWPPAGSFDVFTTTDNLVCRKISFGGGFGYEIDVSLLQFDTSEIPDNATVVSAVLQLQTISAGLLTRSLVVGYYASSNWPIDSGDWSAADNPGSDAGTFALSAFAVGTQEDLTLLSPTSINKTGYTGLRLGINGSTPSDSEDHRIEFASLDHATVTEPQLLVTYTLAPTYHGKVAIP